MNSWGDRYVRGSGKRTPESAPKDLDLRSVWIRECPSISPRPLSDPTPQLRTERRTVSQATLPGHRLSGVTPGVSGNLRRHRPTAAAVAGSGRFTLPLSIYRCLESCGASATATGRQIPAVYERPVRTGRGSL